MTELASTTLENEMDLILAYKKSIKIAELLGLTISTQTAFATAVSEVCREVIDKALEGILTLGTENESSRYFIAARITFLDNDHIQSLREGFEYAKKLVPFFEYTPEGSMATVLMKLAIPRSAKVDQKRVNDIKNYFAEGEPINPYEEVKQKNQELNKLYEEREMALTHANYLNKQKDEFLSVASHELNTPLTVLTTLAQVALRVNDNKDQKLEEFLKKIEIQSSKLRILIQQLLDISKIEHGKADYYKEEIDLNDFITSCVDLIRHFTPQHQLTVKLDKSTRVLIDKLRMEQVINNLVSNAAKYSLPGTVIHITSITDGKKSAIYIKDEGIGMSEETIANIFKKFYRSGDVLHKYRGLGMGLYIASRIVTDHDGEIQVESKEGTGSVFSVHLPVA